MGKERDHSLERDILRLIIKAIYLANDATGASRTSIHSYVKLRMPDAEEGQLEEKLQQCLKAGIVMEAPGTKKKKSRFKLNMDKINLSFRWWKLLPEAEKDKPIIKLPGDKKQGTPKAVRSRKRPQALRGLSTGLKKRTSSVISPPAAASKLFAAPSAGTDESSSLLQPPASGQVSSSS